MSYFSALSSNQLQKIFAMIISIASLSFCLAEIKQFWVLSKPVTGQELTLQMPEPFVLNPDAPIFTVPLFGLAIKETKEMIKNSTLQVQVVGVLYAEEKTMSQVFILENGQTHIYKVGDTFSNGATIERIGKKAVIVRYQGRLERLSLPFQRLVFDKIPPPLEFNGN